MEASSISVCLEPRSAARTRSRRVYAFEALRLWRDWAHLWGTGERGAPLLTPAGDPKPPDLDSVLVRVCLTSAARSLTLLCTLTPHSSAWAVGCGPALNTLCSLWEACEREPREAGGRYLRWGWSWAARAPLGTPGKPFGAASTAARREEEPPLP